MTEIESARRKALEAARQGNRTRLWDADFNLLWDEWHHKGTVQEALERFAPCNATQDHCGQRWSGRVHLNDDNVPEWVNDFEYLEKFTAWPNTWLNKESA